MVVDAPDAVVVTFESREAFGLVCVPELDGVIVGASDELALSFWVGIKGINRVGVF